MAMKTTLTLLAALSLATAASAGYPANKPCSGKKGGIAHCEGKYFVCRDGTTSQSKQDCRAFLGLPAEAGDDSRPPRKKDKNQ